ncbi:MAG: hypothetical protein WC489_00770 [Patescibacteria group bacterium]
MKKFVIVALLLAFSIGAVVALVIRMGEQKSGRLINFQKTAQTGNPQNTRYDKEILESTPAIDTLQNSLTLTIIHPQDNQVVKSGSVLIQGKTAPLVDVIINEHELVSDAKGDFSQEYVLDEGENYISIVSYDSLGNVAEQELTVISEVLEYE